MSFELDLISGSAGSCFGSKRELVGIDFWSEIWVAFRRLISGSA